MDETPAGNVGGVTEPTGAHALVETLVAAGVDVCFMNPGTSEMHFVQALDTAPGLRGVLALFEGVATGAADGYARIAGRPAAVLLHLGPGLGNGLANLHNARRANSPIVVIVGDHATTHARYDAPLQSEIAALAQTVGGWVHSSGTTRDLARDAARAVAATRRDGGQIATLILPADVSWTPGASPAAPAPVPPLEPVAARTIAAAAEALGPQTMLFLGGPALTEAGLQAASRVAVATGTRLLIECFPPNLPAGAGRPAIERLAYFAERAEEQLAGATSLLLAGTPAPVSFFAYPGRSSDLVPARCRVISLADRAQDATAALAALAERVAPGIGPKLSQPVGQPVPDGPLNPAGFAAAVASTLPDHAIVVDESNTNSFGLPPALAGAAPHSLLTLTGGAIGQGLPAAVGAAVAAPERRVLCLEADGSALYTIQALWTMAREQLDVTVVVLNNAAYAILRVEFARTGAGAPGPQATRMLDLADPTTDFVALSTGFGVPARRVTSAAELASALREAYAEAGPHLIEAIIAPLA